MAKRIALTLSVIVAVYVIFAARRGLVLMGARNLTAQVLGVAVLVVTAIGGYLIIREILFGFDIARLGKQFPEEGLLRKSVDQIGAREYLDSAISRAKREEEQGIASWETWYAVGLGYDAVKNRTAARRAMRHAIDIFRKSQDA